MKWMINPPERPSTWIAPTAELPPFMQRRLRNPHKRTREGTFLYTHPYINYLERMVLWARNEHNAEFHYAADHNMTTLIRSLRKFGPEYILAMHEDFASMVEMMTPEMWDLLDRRMRDHLTAAFEVAKRMGIVRPTIPVEKAIKMLQEMEPPKRTSREMVNSIINHFIPKGRQARR